MTSSRVMWVILLLGLMRWAEQRGSALAAVSLLQFAHVSCCHGSMLYVSVLYIAQISMVYIICYICCILYFMQWGFRRVRCAIVSRVIPEFLARAAQVHAASKNSVL
jgi:hypothetical protein